jgi:hypothetical protein
MVSDATGQQNLLYLIFFDKITEAIEKGEYTALLVSFLIYEKHLTQLITDS